MILFSLILIALVSIIWALAALKRERNKKEIIERAKEDITRGRVVFHSSDASDSASS